MFHHGIRGAASGGTLATMLGVAAKPWAKLLEFFWTVVLDPYCYTCAHYNVLLHDSVLLQHCILVRTVKLLRTVTPLHTGTYGYTTTYCFVLSHVRAQLLSYFFYTCARARVRVPNFLFLTSVRARVSTYQS